MDAGKRARKKHAQKLKQKQRKKVAIGGQNIQGKELDLDPSLFNLKAIKGGKDVRRPARVI
eukprot:8844710-Pyramimonas_sp.AAC.1